MRRAGSTWTVILRKFLGAGAIATTRRGYRLDLPGDEVDAQRFARLVGRGRELFASEFHMSAIGSQA